MKKNYLIVALLVVTAFLYGTTTDVLADGQNLSPRKYAISELGDYLSGWEYDSEDKVEISQKYKINGADNDSSLFFVKIDDTQVGAISVSKVEGENRSAFLYGEDIFERIDEDEKIAVLSNDTGINLCSIDETKVLTGNDAGTNINQDNSKYNLKQIEYKDITDSVEVDSSKVNVNNVQIDAQVSDGDYETNFAYIGTHQKKYKTIVNTANTLMLFTTKLDLIPNASVNNVGLCWAATGASIINYKRGGTTYCTAIKVYNALKSAYGGTPSGTIEWEQRMWNYYALSMNKVDHKLSFTNVLYLMEAHKPVFCSFLHNEKNTDNNYAHAVALCGCYYRTDLKKYYYVYMDPNWAGSGLYVVNHIFESELNGSTGYKFYYNPGNGDIYNNWRYAFY